MERNEVKTLEGADLEGLKQQIAESMLQALQAHAEELKIFVENQLSQVTLLLSGSQVQQIPPPPPEDQD